MSHLRVFAFLVCSAVLVGAQTVNLDNFNSPGATGAVILSSTWANNVTRNPDTIVVAGNAKDDNGWGAIGQSLDATGMAFVTIFARRDAGNVAPSLVLQFEDNLLRTHTLSVSTSLFALGTITAVQLPLGTLPSGFNRAQITGWSIGGGTSGIVAFRMTFDHVALSPTAALSAPTITEQPLDRVIGVDTGTTLTVSATGSPTLRYQWKRNGTAIDGATTATLAFSNTPLSAAATYQVDVANDVGTTPSRVATLAVLDVRPTHTLAAASVGGFVPGKTVTISNTISYTGTGANAPTNLGWQVLLPPGWSFASDAGTAPQTKPPVNATGVAEWTWTTVPPSPVTFTYTLNVPDNATGAQSITGQLLVTQSASAGVVLAKNDPLIVPAAILPHSADTDGDYRIGLVELTRVIQLYNTRPGTTRTGAYAVAVTVTEDGFTPDFSRPLGTVVALTRYHASDTNRDGTISLLELTRGIELYNYRVGTVRTGQYRVQAGTEDGFAPGP